MVLTVLKVWKSLYTGSKLKSYVKVNGKLTEDFDCTTGTRQGCVGSPKLFSIFINELIKYLETKFNRGNLVTADILDLLTLMFADVI